MTKKANKAPFALLTTVKAIDAATKDIAVRGTSLQVDMHIVACSVLAHVGKHGQIGIVNNFLAAIPDMARINAIKVWFEKFSKVTFVGADGKTLKSPVYVSGKAQRLGDAMETPFWKLKAKEGEAYEAIVMDKYLDQQIKKLQKDQTETKRDWSPLIKSLQAMKLAQAPVALPN